MKRQSNKSAESRMAILKISQKLFNTKGFQETAISDIMGQVGMAKGAFYYYFESKDQILDVLVDQYVEGKISAMKPIMDNNGMNALEKLKQMFLTEFQYDRTHNKPEAHLHDIKNVDMHQRILVKMVEKYAPVIAMVIEQGTAKGSFQVDHPLEVTEFILSGFHFLCDTGIFRWNMDAYLRKVKATEEIIEKAIGLERGSFGFLSELLASQAGSPTDS